MKGILKWFSLAIILAACSPQPKKDIDVCRAVVVPEANGLIRGAKMGMTQNELKSVESGVLVGESDSLLFFQTGFLLDDTIKANVFYSFDSFGLFEVQLDLYRANSKWPSDQLKELDSCFTSAFGEYDKLGSTKRWTTISGSNSVIEISLGIELDQDDKPFLSLNFLEPLDDRF